MLIPAVLVAAVIFSLWYVQAPPRSPDAYRDRAATTLETLAQIGERLGISQMRVSRLLRRTIGRLRAIAES